MSGGTPPTPPPPPTDSRASLAAALGIFAVGALLVLFVLLSLPPLSAAERALIHIPPRSLDHVKDLARVGSRYTHDYYWTVLASVAVVYVFLQAFSIPGSIGLSVVSGALFGVSVGFPLVIVCATVGPTISFALSHLVGRRVTQWLFPNQMVWFAKQVEARRSSLFNFLLFLRITPFLPNFFINLASPLLGVPVHYFVIATFFGIMPATFMHVSAGRELQHMTEMGGALDLWRFVWLSLLGCVVLLPTWGPVQRLLDRMLNRGAGGAIGDELLAMKKA